MTSLTKSSSKSDPNPSPVNSISNPGIGYGAPLVDQRVSYTAVWYAPYYSRFVSCHKRSYTEISDHITVVRDHSEADWDMLAPENIYKKPLYKASTRGGNDVRYALTQYFLKNSI
ncbi:unnamed protein product [Rotaria socialis]|nr:unnamed protein product [Rotaria socialis]